ncbi:MAG: LysM domain-containing protein [Verrucomicrobiota bacterium]
MKPHLLIALLLLPRAGLADPPLSPPAPTESTLQEQYILVSAKMKNMAEMQDLILQQQQLMLQHLDALRKDVEALQRERTNAPTRLEFENSVRKLDEVQRGLESLRVATQAKPCPPPEATSSSDERPALAASAGRKLTTYKVQTGDTFSRILARFNEELDRNKLPRITSEQVEQANPGLNPDRIRAGQTIFIPVTAGSPSPGSSPR